jgi:hypothetical protein
MSRTITLLDIRPKNNTLPPEEVAKRSRWGTFNAIVTIGDNIRLYGIWCGREFDRVFKIGDNVEYGSNNLSYFGPVLAITNKCVIVRDSFYTDRTKRIDYYTFAWRNYNFNHKEAEARNEAMRPHLNAAPVVPNKK